MHKYCFTLYLFGRNQRSEQIIVQLRRMLDQEAGAEYELTICDVQGEPQVAEKNKILATPALVLTSPQPSRMIVGDLADTDRVRNYFSGLFGEG